MKKSYLLILMFVLLVSSSLAIQSNLPSCWVTSSSGVSIDSNCDGIIDNAQYVNSSVYYNQSQINSALLLKLNVSDQRYNDTVRINLVNSSLQTEITNRINGDASLQNQINNLNTTSNTTVSNLQIQINEVNTSGNIKSLGFNLTSELKTYFDSLYYSISNPSQFINNTTNNLVNYYTISQIDSQQLTQNNTINLINTTSNIMSLQFYNKTEVDNLIPIQYKLYFTNLSSNISNYYLMQQNYPNGSAANFSFTSVLNNQLLFNFSSLNSTGFIELNSGQLESDIHVMQTAGSTTSYIYSKYYVRHLNGSEELLCTSTNSIVSNTLTDVRMTCAIQTTPIDKDSDMFVVKIYSSWSGGSAPNLLFSIGDTLGCGFGIPVARTTFFEQDPFYFSNPNNYYNSSTLPYQSSSGGWVNDSVDTNTTLTVNIGNNVQGSNLNTYATLSSLVVSMNASDWTLTSGWNNTNDGNTQLDKNAAGTTTATPSSTTAANLTIPTIGTTYKITITANISVASGFTWTYGSLTMPAITNSGTYSYYVTPTTTGKLIFTPTPTTTRFTISYIQIDTLVSNTGDVKVEGDLMLDGNVVKNNISVIKISPNGDLTTPAGLAIGGALSGVTTGGFSSTVTITQNLAGILTNGLVLADTTASTTGIPVHNSGSLFMSGTVYNGSVSTGYNYSFTASASNNSNSYLLLTSNRAGVTRNITMITDDGRVGINTVTPIAALDVHGNGTDGEPALYVGDSNLNHNFVVMNSGNTGIGTASPQAKLVIGSGGHLETNQTTLPNVTNCGSGAIVTNKSADIAGEVTVGSGAGSSCTIVFASVWNNVPHCMLSEHTSTVSLTKTETTTNMTINGAAISGDKIDWICIGNE